MDQLETILREQLADLEGTERNLRAGGHLKQADQIARGVARVRRKLDRWVAGEDARRAAVSAMVAPLLAGLEQHLAGCGAHE
ncbi:hypothetical protein [Ralstonia pseudosolanacearum]|nr:hypothetical protein [Ralstonia pseudosolanacearum]MDO3518146.1 hypothetical protein [Ralstonia pseudosolanacearum]MDO3540666.1 hypothetical protein [Ralstonia pseudosolanacearum]